MDRHLCFLIALPLVGLAFEIANRTYLEVLGRVVEEKELFAFVYPALRVYSGELWEIESPSYWHKLGVLILHVIILLLR